jgi:tetratricopeptide (TPR) repeat protein
LQPNRFWGRFAVVLLALIVIATGIVLVRMRSTTVATPPLIQAPEPAVAQQIPAPMIAATVLVRSNVPVVNPNAFEVKKTTRQPAGPPRQALVALWSGEGNGNDSVGNNTAILTDMTFAEGKVGGAFSLNGSSSYAKVPSNSSLDMESRDGLTLSLWIKPFDVSGFHPILEWYSSNTRPLGIGSQLRLGQNARSQGVLEAVIVDMNGHYHVLRSPPDTVVANSFQHVAVTYDQASGAGILYLNGRVVAQSQWKSFPPKTKGDLWISCRPFSHPGDFTYNTFFAGLLDEIAIYNRALTAGEIQTYYNAVLTGRILQSNQPTPAMAATAFVNPGAWGNLLNEDQRLMAQWTDQKFNKFFDERTFDGWSNNERAGLERRLIDTLKGPRSDEYYQAINSLAALHSINALPALREIAFDRQEKDNRDRWMSVRALGLLGDRQSAPEMIHLLYHYNVNTRWWAQISLVRLTGQNFGKDWQAWGKWWNSQNSQPPFNPEIIRWSKTQAEPDQLAESLAESDRRFLEGIQGRNEHVTSPFQQLPADIASAMNASDFGKAQSLSAEATRLNPQFAEAWVADGMVSARLGQFDRARQAYERALSLYQGKSRENPSNADSVFQQIFLLTLLGRSAEAETLLEQARKSHPDDNPLAMLAQNFSDVKSGLTNWMVKTQ